MVEMARCNCLVIYNTTTHLEFLIPKYSFISMMIFVPANCQKNKHHPSLKEEADKSDLSR